MWKGSLHGFLVQKGKALPVSQLMANGESYDQLPSGDVKIAIDRMAIEIVDLALKIGMFHSYVSLPEGSSCRNENTPLESVGGCTSYTDWLVGDWYNHV